MPYRLSPPANLSAAGENLSLIQLSSHGIDAELLLRVHLRHPAHHLSFRFHHLVIARRGVALLHVVVAVRSPGKYIHHALLRLVPFSAATPFCDPRLWSRRGIGEKPSSHRHGRTLLPAKPDRHTYGSAGPANRPEPAPSGLALPSHATPLIPAVPR